MTERPIAVQRGGRSVVLAAAILVACFALGELAHPPRLIPPTDSARAPYAQRVAALLRRHDASTATLDQLLTQRDANPGLVASVEWLEQDARVVQELQTEYQEAQALTPPADAIDRHRCLVEALRLTSLGATMLHDAFRIDGHGAYYLGAHGNWNLQLGGAQLQRCRASLAG